MTNVNMINGKPIGMNVSQYDQTFNNRVMVVFQFLEEPGKELQDHKCRKKRKNGRNRKRGALRAYSAVVLTDWAGDEGGGGGGGGAGM